MPTIAVTEKSETQTLVNLPKFWLQRLSKIDFAFQPIVNINDGLIFGYEALLRNYREAGFDSIVELFDSAYIENILHTVDLKLRAIAIRKFKRISWHHKAKLFYNIDNRIWESPDYRFELAMSLFDEIQFDADSFCAEISEKHLIDYDSSIFNKLKSAKKKGLKVAVDDCGAGFSGLKLMYYSEPDYVKIDRFFIMDIAKNPRKRLFVSNIVNISHMIGSIVIAEGVESKDEYYICREIGCDLVQGYYVDYPQVDLNRLCVQYEHIQELSDADRRFKDTDDKKYIQTQMAFIPPVSDEIGVVEIFEKFKNPNAHPFYPVVNENNEPLGLISEKSFKPFAYSRFGAELLRNRRYANGLHEFVTKCPIADIKTPVEKILQLFSQDFDSVEGILIVENLKYVGFLDTRSLLKALNEKNVAYARDQNPLTRLPGNTLIHQYLSESIGDLESQYIFVYFDFNHFKPYNDKYGFRNGDRVIVLFSEILKKCTFKFETFIGHIGGDDFFMGIRNCRCEEAIAKIGGIVESFGKNVQSFYGREELRMGYIVSKDRDENVKQFPLLSVSAAVLELPIERTRVISNSEIGEIIAALKKKAKQNPDKIAFESLSD